MCARGRRRGTVGAAVRRHGGNARQEGRRINGKGGFSFINRASEVNLEEFLHSGFTGGFANCGSRTVSVCKRCESKLGS